MSGFMAFGMASIMESWDGSRKRTRRQRRREPFWLKLAFLPRWRRPLATASFALNRSLALNVHPIVQDAYDFDRSVRRRAVHQEVTSTTTAPRDMERTKTGRDFVAALGARNIGTLG